MNSVTKLIGYSLLFAAMFAIAGGHLLVIQTVAWSTMIVKYSRGVTVAEAVEKTFSGKAPCKLCKAVEAGHGDQSKIPLSLKVDKKFEVILESFPLLGSKLNDQNFQYPSSRPEMFPSRSEEPPQPVPISVLS